MTGNESRFALSERPILDTLAALVVVLLHSLVISRFWLDVWSDVDTSTRQLIFQTGAGVVAIVAALAAVGLAAGGAGERGKSLRRLYGKELRRNWRALLIVSAVAPTTVLGAQVVEANRGGAVAPYLFEFAVLWTALRLLRLTWMIDALMRAEELDAAEVGRTPTLGLSEDFMKRTGAARSDRKRARGSKERHLQVGDPGGYRREERTNPSLLDDLEGRETQEGRA